MLLNVEAAATADTDYIYSGVVYSPANLTYKPKLTKKTLRLSTSSGLDTVGDDEYSVVYLTGGGEDSHSLTFQGEFGTDPDLISISYTHYDTGSSFDCDNLVLTENGTRLTCSTTVEESQPQGVYYLTAIVDTVASNSSVDQLVFPQAPEVTSVIGCTMQNNNQTSDCSTAGGETVTIYGKHLNVDMVRFCI